ncbi:MAG: hypothetical protein Q8O67_08720 [Deltaproteobacteria bacterium]|nr:hypothetical protein [Deltaproteobacteria bacterium]
MLLLLLALSAQPEEAPPPPAPPAAVTVADPAPTPPTPTPTPTPTTPTTEQQCTLAILDLEVGDAMALARARALSDVVTGEVAALSKCSVLSRSDIRGMLSFESEKQLMGCASDSCMAELAGALGADFLLTGTVSRIEGSLLLSLRMTDMKSLKVARRTTDSFAGDDADAIPFVAWLSRKLMTDDPSVIGVRPVAAPRGAPQKESTVWRPLFWTSFTLTLVSAAVTGAAGATTVALSDAVKSNSINPSQVADIGPTVADVANGGLYATGALILGTVVLFFFPAEEEVKP